MQNRRTTKKGQTQRKEEKGGEEGREEESKAGKEEGKADERRKEKIGKYISRTTYDNMVSAEFTGVVHNTCCLNSPV